MGCDSISNPMMDISQLIASVNNPPGQPFQDIQIQTSQRNDGGQVGGPGTSNPNGNSGQQIGKGAGGAQGALGQSFGVKSMKAKCIDVAIMAAVVVLWNSLG